MKLMEMEPITSYSKGNSQNKYHPTRISEKGEKLVYVFKELSLPGIFVCNYTIVFSVRMKKETISRNMK
jgi:hypothetical protein